MRIALIAPPFIEVPPVRYGGTELFVANLACELYRRGHDVTVYANGASHVPCRVKFRYPAPEWPLTDSVAPILKNTDHTAWAIHDAVRNDVDVIHLNDVVGVPFTLFAPTPAVLTIHHPHEPVLSDQYERYPDIHYVAIADWLARLEPMPHVHVVHHGVPLQDYTFASRKDDYVAFLGRITPCKGPHLAIEAARRAGIDLKIAGEIQPMFRDYWEREVRPHVDGQRVEYLGEADKTMKNELLSRARALLFPIQWDEPFGLVMIEAMACGTPVLAFPGGAVEEIVRDGVNGRICLDVAEMAGWIERPAVRADDCRSTVAERFSVERMADAYLEVYEEAAVKSHSDFEQALGA